MMEAIIRPFQTNGVSPVPFTKPGAQKNEIVRVAIGLSGAIKTMQTSFSASITTKMGQSHREHKPSNSEALRQQMDKLARGTPVG